MIRSHRLMQWWAGAASAIAACLFVVLSAQFFLKPHPIDNGGGNLATTTPATIDQVTYTRNVDGGTVVLDDQTPARLIRQQTVRQTQWFDPNEKATYSVTVPVEKVEYVEIHPY